MRPARPLPGTPAPARAQKRTALRPRCAWWPGPTRWELDKDLKTPIDAHALPGGRVLVAELNGGRVTERDRDGRILWQFAVDTPVACERLADGHTFISTNHHAFVVTPAGKEVYSY